MRYGIFSDIHSNLEAFEAVIQAYKTEKIDIYFCLGDIVGYGANPVECIQMVEEMSRVIIAGNHDWAVTGLTPLEYFNDWAKQAVLWTQERMDTTKFEFLRSLRLTYENKDLILAHGSLNNPQQFNYMANIIEPIKTFVLMNRSICFVGHTHASGAFIQDKNGEMDYQRQASMRLKRGYRYIVDVGSVGQPRDGNNQACYCVYDSEKKEVLIKRVSYNVKSAQKKILANGLPQFLADRLSAGR